MAGLSEQTRSGNPDACNVSPGGGITVAAFTGSRTISSSRFRVRQYIPSLGAYGVSVTEYVARLGSWPPSKKAWRPFWLPATLLDRIPDVVRSHRCDLTLFQREMVSTMVTLERFTGRPRILDVDDAVWLNRGGEKNFARLVRICDGIICGNNFIAENVRRWHGNICLLPTAVDTERFCPAEVPLNGSRQVIGWSGLGAGFGYLMNIEAALADVLQVHKRAILRVVSDMRPSFNLIDSARIEYIPWSPEAEVTAMQGMSVGLMPIEDSDWGRGKCSYKMLQYMSCGVPVVVSPVGMNNEVLAWGRSGFTASSASDWVDSINWLLNQPEKGREMGRVGRRVVEENYSLRILSPRLAAYLKEFSRQV
jgi:glycosyltransferase involved in cell wall biosynthesis